MQDFKCDVAATTDVGLVRLNNQDAFVCDSGAGLFLVCDGMGGEHAGEVASNLAVHTILSVVRKGEDTPYDDIDDLFFQSVPTHNSNSGGDSAAPGGSGKDLLSSAIRTANREIHIMSEAIVTQRGMGTTVAAVLIKGRSATVAHAGDSRVYLLRDGSLQPLTQDHSVVAEQVRAGIISQEMAQHSPYKSYVTRALGPAEDVQPDVSEIGLRDGDLFLIATDGLTGPVSDHEMLAILDGSPSLNEACLMLIEAAKRNGSTDNITCVLVKVQLAGTSREITLDTVA